MSEKIVNGAAVMPTDAPSQQWFAMRATYRREMAVKALLDLEGIDSYLPLTQTMRTYRGKKMRVTAPLVNSLIFVHTDKDRLQHFKAKVPYLQYMTTRMGGRNLPIIVPDRQMQDFVQVTSTESQKMIFFKPGELDATRGAQVRIHGGAFDGIEGVLTKIVGRRNKRLVIEVHDVIAVAVECSDANFVEVL